MSDRLKILVLAIALLAALGAAFLVFGRGETGRALGPRPTAPDASPAAETTLARPRRAAAVAIEGANEDPERETSSDAAPTDAETARRIAFQVSLEDLAGRPLPAPSGILSLAAYRESGSGWDIRLDCRIEAGRGVLEVPEDIRTVLGAAEMRVEPDSRLALDRDHQTIDLARKRDETQVLRLRLAPRLRLRVQDAEDRRELDAVRVILPSVSWTDHEGPPPATSGMEALAEGRSPLVLDIREHGSFRTYWVLAPGHAAVAVRFDGATEGERLVLLPVGGTLAVSIEGDPRGIPDLLLPYLRLRSLEGAGPPEILSEAFWSGQDEMVFENVAAGRHLLAFEAGESGNPVELARAEFVIRPGETTRLRLDPDLTRLRVKLAPVSARIILPEAERRARDLVVRIVLAAPDPDHPRPAVSPSFRPAHDEGPAVLRFDQVLLVPGSYVAEIAGERFPFELPPEGRDDLVFELGVQEMVEIRVREAGSDLPVRDANIRWFANERHGDAGWNDARGAYEAAPPTGDIEFMIWRNGEFNRARARRAEGQTTIDLVIMRGQSFRLVLRCGEIVIPHDFLLPIELTDAAGRPVSIPSAEADGDSVTRHLDKPGRYRIRLPQPPPGHRARGPVDFEVRAGETVEVVVELERDL